MRELSFSPDGNYSRFIYHFSYRQEINLHFFLFFSLSLSDWEFDVDISRIDSIRKNKIYAEKIPPISIFCVY